MHKNQIPRVVLSVFRKIMLIGHGAKSAPVLTIIGLWRCFLTIAALSGIGFCALSLLFSVPFLPYPTSVHWWTYMAVGLSVLLIMIITYLGTPLLIIGAIEIGKLWE
ncbi:hypothetical protein P9A10_25190 [Serratia marcescens]|uniref:hypothetical protein n=1 Tax=Serratia marcescens TaxID=615 RepID=UPI003204D9B1